MPTRWSINRSSWTRSWRRSGLLLSFRPVALLDIMYIGRWWARRGTVNARPCWQAQASREGTYGPVLRDDRARPATSVPRLRRARHLRFLLSDPSPLPQLRHRLRARLRLLHRLGVHQPPG